MRGAPLGRLRGDLQARAQGEDPHAHPVPHGRRADSGRDRYARGLLRGADCVRAG